MYWLLKEQRQLETVAEKKNNFLEGFFIKKKKKKKNEKFNFLQKINLYCKQSIALKCTSPYQIVRDC
jgi:hypothetical protein